MPTITTCASGRRRDPQSPLRLARRDEVEVIENGPRRPSDLQRLRQRAAKRPPASPSATSAAPCAACLAAEANRFQRPYPPRARPYPSVAPRALYEGVAPRPCGRRARSRTGVARPPSSSPPLSPRSRRRRPTRVGRVRSRAPPAWCPEMPVAPAIVIAPPRNSQSLSRLPARNATSPSSAPAAPIPSGPDAPDAVHDASGIHGDGGGKRSPSSRSTSDTFSMRTRAAPSAP